MISAGTRGMYEDEVAEITVCWRWRGSTAMAGGAAVTVDAHVAGGDLGDDGDVAGP